jgi:hypothetical protein
LLVWIFRPHSREQVRHDFGLDKLRRAWLIALAVGGYAGMSRLPRQNKCHSRMPRGPADENGNSLRNGASIYYRDVGTSDEVVVLLHGFPKPAIRCPCHRRAGRRFRLLFRICGFGKSSPTRSGYDKRTMAADIRVCSIERRRSRPCCQL